MTVGAGEQVGQYILRREIGRGGMATVYEAEHVDLGKRVALKRMHAHLATDERAVSRFLREGRAATQIRSPHVVEVFDVGKHQGIPFLVMELLEGVDLAAFLLQRKRLSPADVAEIMVRVATAVHAAHVAGVIHRDLKPSNVLLSTSRRDERAPSSARKRGGSVDFSPVILDFGISKRADDGHEATASEVLLGTVYYMSPEQTRGGKKASAASDQYALGVMLYECLTGIKPFLGSTPYAVMHAVVSADLRAPSAVSPGVPAALDGIVLRAMHRDPQRRFPSVRALGSALLPWASPETREQFATELGPGEPAALAGGSRVVRRARAVVIIGLTVALALGARSLALRAGEPPKGAGGAGGKALPAPSQQDATPVLLVEPTPAETERPRESPPPVSSAGRDVAARPRAPARSPSSVSSADARPERGTNGALIVE